MKLPESMYFLKSAWLIIHGISVAMVFVIGSLSIAWFLVYACV